MRILIMAAVVVATLVPAASQAGGFHVDDIKPGEGAESDCFTAFARPETKPVAGESDPRDIFEIVDETGFIKIDGTMHNVQRIKDSKPSTYRDAEVSVSDLSRIVRAEKSPDGNTYYLKGTLKVTFKGQTQTLTVVGESFCYSGG
jgi:hypothetical protein